MELQTAIRLIEKGINAKSKQVWADLGAGRGLFTKALASILKKESVVYAIDRDPNALRHISKIKDVKTETLVLDFVNEPLPSFSFDGIVMANALHYVDEKIAFLHRLKKSLSPDGRIIFLEYELKTSNPWVPYPVTFSQLREVCNEVGFSLQRLDQEPSVYHNTVIYSALATSF